MRRSVAAVGISAVTLASLAPTFARADSLAPAAAEPIAPFVTAPVPAMLVGSAGGGSGAYANGPEGLFLGVEIGHATMVAAGGADASGGFAFAARAGYAWPNGLALQIRAEDTGVPRADIGGDLVLVTIGARYSLPLPIMPYAEAMAGPAIYGGTSTFGTVIGLGVTIPVLRHLAIDLGGRDAIAEIDGVVRNVPAFSLGITVGFGAR